MGLSVRAKADTVATYRFIAIHLMETLAGWTPTSPELEAKALFGRHIWDLAQLADLLGKRTAELRMALHQNRTPLPSYRQALEQVRAAASTGDRLAAFYDGALPDLARRYDQYLTVTDHLLDEPTVRIIERAQLDLRRMLAQRTELLAERPDLKAHAAASLDRVRAALASVADFVDYQPAPVEAK